MESPPDTHVAEIVERFLDRRRRERRLTIDEVLDAYPDLHDRNGVRADALRSIGARLRSAESPDRSTSFGGPAAQSAPSDDSELPILEGYALIDAIGRGGMGVVYEAYQLSTGRRVAVKFMRAASVTNEIARRRFEREVELVARLQHPHIVPVIDSGVCRGEYFYVMEFIEGEPLDRALAPGRCAVREALHTLSDICAAVDHAHQRGVLHRDLKPSNILIDKARCPHILDFGLAKAIEPGQDGLARSLSEPGQLLGTLAYMSPEQSRGQFDEMSVRSDVYSLGAIAYELVTGSVPCAVNGPLADALQCISVRDPSRPSSLRPGIGADVDAILLKALEKLPSARYATAAEFGADCRCFLDHRSIVARRAGPVVRIRRWIRRNRLTTGISAVALLIVAAVLAVSFQRIRTQRDLALAAEEQARREAQTAAAVTDYLIGLFGLMDPFETNRAGFTVRRLLDIGSERLADYLPDRPLLKASIMSAMGTASKNLHDFERAEPLLNGALALRRAHLPPEHPDIAESLALLAGLRHAEHKTARAETLYREAVDILRLHSDRAGELASTQRYRAWALSALDRHDEAKRAINETLDIERELAPLGNEQTARSLEVAGIVFAAAGEQLNAKRYYQEAIGLWRREFAPDHPHVAAAMTGLAKLHDDLNEHEDAEAFFARALEIQRHARDADPLDLAETLHAFGRHYWFVKRHQAAIPLLQESLQIRTSILERQHQSCAATANLLSKALWHLGRNDMDRRDWVSAEGHLRESIRVRREAGLAEDKRMDRIETDLSRCLMHLGGKGNESPE